MDFDVDELKQSLRDRWLTQIGQALLQEVLDAIGERRPLPTGVSKLAV